MTKVTGVSENLSKSGAPSEWVTGEIQATKPQVDFSQHTAVDGGAATEDTRA